MAPARLAGAPFVELGLGTQFNLPQGFYTALGVDGQTHFLRLLDPTRPEGKVSAAFALRSGLALGKYF